MTTIQKVCVYCASSAKIPKKYFDATRTMASDLVKHKIEFVYGGGAAGLMGCLADTVLAHGGKIKGIMPYFMKEVEWAHQGVNEWEFTETMHERKAKFLQGIDALIALPGGTGTFEELFEAITLKRLGLLHVPIVILNTDGFYNPMKELLERCVEENFMHPKHLEMWSFVDEPLEVFTALNNAPPWDEDAISFASPR